jgi:hypothetical protein
MLMSAYRGMRLLFVLIVALAVGIFSGCSTGELGVENEFGTIIGFVEATPEPATNAAVMAVRDLKFSLISSGFDALAGRVIARTSMDDRIDIDIYSKGKNISKVSIRVGTFGDESISLRILDKIKDKLGRR